MNSFAPYDRAQPQSTSRAIRLTPRELEVLALLGEGLPNKLMSRRLGISSATVKCHISRILNELGVSSRLQALVAAARCGLLNENEALSFRPEDTLARCKSAAITGISLVGGTAVMPASA